MVSCFCYFSFIKKEREVHQFRTVVQKKAMEFCEKMFTVAVTVVLAATIAVPIWFLWGHGQAISIAVGFACGVLIREYLSRNK
jgi:membrane protein YdbS with pleckstrin-like domain